MATHATEEIFFDLFSFVLNYLCFISVFVILFYLVNFLAPFLRNNRPATSVIADISLYSIESIKRLKPMKHVRLSLVYKGITCLYNHHNQSNIFELYRLNTINLKTTSKY